MVAFLLVTALITGLTFLQLQRSDRSPGKTHYVEALPGIAG